LIILRDGKLIAAAEEANRRFALPAAQSKKIATRTSCVDAPPLPLRMGKLSAGFKDEWNGARAPSATARFCAIRAAPI
jgi:hypothetical protein